MIVPESFSLGQATAAVPGQPAVAAPASSWVDTLTKGMEIIGKGAEVYSTYKATKLASKTPAAPAYPQMPPGYYQQVAPTTTGMDTKQILMIAGGAVAVVGLVYFLTRS